MLDKIKSIKNNLRIGDKLEELRIKEMSAQIAGFSRKFTVLFTDFSTWREKTSAGAAFPQIWFRFRDLSSAFCH